MGKNFFTALYTFQVDPRVREYLDLEGTLTVLQATCFII